VKSRKDPLSEFLDFLTAPIDKLSNPGEVTELAEYLPAPPPLPPFPLAFYNMLRGGKIEVPREGST